VLTAAGGDGELEPRDVRADDQDEHMFARLRRARLPYGQINANCDYGGESGVAPPPIGRAPLRRLFP
jgi:hypothetical protein